MCVYLDQEGVMLVCELSGSGRLGQTACASVRVWQGALEEVMNMSEGSSVMPLGLTLKTCPLL